MEIALPAGEYSVTASLGDDFLERTLTLSQDQPSAHIGFDAIAFSSPVPIAGTATNREYQAAGVGELRRIAAAHLAAAEVQPSAGAILIFARDSADRDRTAWRMPAQLQAGLRLRRLYGGAAEPLTVEGLPFINIERGFSAALYPPLRRALTWSAYAILLMRVLIGKRLWLRWHRAGAPKCSSIASTMTRPRGDLMWNRQA